MSARQIACTEYCLPFLARKIFNPRLASLHCNQRCNLQLLHASPSSVGTRWWSLLLTPVAAGLAGQEIQANAKPTAALGDGAPGSEDPTLKLPKVSMLQLRLHLPVTSKQPLAEWAAVGCNIARALEQRQTRLTKVEHVRFHQLPPPWLLRFACK